MVKICNEFSATVNEVTISVDGISFLCLCGNHINGAYISILDAGVAAELSSCTGDYDYNAEKILDALERSGDPTVIRMMNIPRKELKQKMMEIAKAIAPYIELTEEKQIDALKKAIGVK